MRAELAALREALAALAIPERKRFDHAAEEAADEAAKPAPDKAEVAGALTRMVKYARSADDFGAHAASVAPRVAALGSWLGEYGPPLPRLIGLPV